MKRTTMVMLAVLSAVLISCEPENINDRSIDKTRIEKGLAKYSDKELVAYAEQAARESLQLEGIIKEFEAYDIFKKNRDYPNIITINRDKGQVTFSHSGCEYDGTSIDLSIFIYPESSKNINVYKTRVELTPCGYE